MIRFGVLGSLTVELDGKPVLLRAPLLRRLLAALLSGSPRLVSVDELINVLWGQRPPASARKTLQVYVHRLRVMFGNEEILEHEGGGYRIAIDGKQLDAIQFRSLTKLAADCHRADDVKQAEQKLADALGIWRGAAFDGFTDLPLVSEEAARLEEERMCARLEHVEIRLELGSHQELVSELLQLAAEHPYREDVTAHLMVALYRSGRQADALEVYRKARRTLDEDLGILPGLPLEQLHESILRSDRALLGRTRGGRFSGDSAKAREQGDSASIRAHMLPPDLPDFLGRTTEVDWLLDRLSRQSVGAVVTAISGRAGVGKSTLCIHVAHLLRERYPDGQLFASLNGAGADQPSQPFEVIGRFLRALGVEALPEDIEERIDLYRAILADRRILIVLDNAANADHLLPLIPGSQSCSVIVNSRVRLGAALGADVLDLDVLEPGDAVKLLAHIAGAQRVAPETEAATTLASLCGHLPLALRIAAAKLVAKPHWSVARLVDRLGDERRRLDQLSYEQLDVRSSLALSHQGLKPEAQQLLNRLGDFNATIVSAWMAAALLDMSCSAAEDVLEILYDARLLDIASQDASGYLRYRLHDLVRLLARQYALREEDPNVLKAARQRVCEALLYLLDRVHLRVFGGDYENIRSSASRWAPEPSLEESTINEPLRWFDEERSTIISVIRCAADDQLSSVSWGLACTASPLFQMRRCFDDWSEILDSAHSACHSANDLHGLAALAYRRGMVFADRQEYKAALDQFQNARRLFEQVDDQHGAAIATVYTAMIDRWDGRYERALERYEQAVNELQDSNDNGTIALALRGVGQIHLDRNDYPEADVYLSRALAVARQGGAARHVAQTLFWQGMLRIKQSLFDDAERAFAEVLKLTRALGDRPGEAQAIRGMGLSCKGRGDLRQAAERLGEALQLVRQPRPTLLEGCIHAELAEVVQLLEVPGPVQT